MGVGVFYYFERDSVEDIMANPESLLFSSKKEADERDKMLEYSEAVLEFLQREVPGLSEEMADLVAIKIAENRDLFARAAKNPEVLNVQKETGDE